MKKLKISANNKRYKEEANVKLKNTTTVKKFFNSMDRINMERTLEEGQRKESVNLMLDQ